MAIVDKDMLLKVQAFHDNALGPTDAAAMRERLMADPELRDVLKGMELTSQSARTAFDAALEEVNWAAMTESILDAAPALQSSTPARPGGFFDWLGGRRAAQWVALAVAASFVVGAYALLARGAGEQSGQSSPAIAAPVRPQQGVVMEPVVLDDDGDKIIFMEESDEQGGEL